MSEKVTGLKKWNTAECYNVNHSTNSYINVKQSHDTAMEAKGERMYSSYSFTTSAINGSE
jgi:hypothetical protein